jgi:hypothetical protein
MELSLLKGREGNRPSDSLILGWKRPGNRQKVVVARAGALLCEASSFEV